MASSLFGTPNQTIPTINPNLMNNVNQIKNLMLMVKNSQNPQAMFNSLMGQNPQLQSAMQTINQLGGDPKQAFYKDCQRRGIDPNEVINALNQITNTF